MCDLASAAAKGIWKYVYVWIKTYLCYIQNYDQNLNSLCEELEKLCAEKKDVDVKVLIGKGKLEKLTFKALHWLARVHDLSKDEEMKKLMTKDMGIAKAMLRLMKNADLKKLVEKDGEMRDLIVKVTKDIAKRVRPAEEKDEEKDEEVARVLEMLMEETMGEFKTLMQNDKYMAAAALHLLENHMEILKSLMENDKELADIIAKAREMSHEEEWSSHDNDDNVLVCESTLRKKVANLLKPVGEVILNEELLKALPDNVALGMKAMGIVIGNTTELKAKLMGARKTASHRNCCSCTTISCNYFCDRHDTSVAAESMLNKITDIIKDKPGNEDLTRSVGEEEMEGIPTNSVGLKSRKELLLNIVKALTDTDIQAVGVFGMGGSGKTTLAKEIVNSKANGLFQKTIMLEISESPNIEYIQNQIACGLGLPLHNVHGEPQKAIRLYNGMKVGEESEGRKNDNISKKILIVLDNIWEEIDLFRIGLPLEHCKLLLMSRTKNVCKAMGLLETNIFEMGLLNNDEAQNLFKFQVQREVIGEYKVVARRLLEKCGGLPLSIVATANSLKGKELPLWRQFAEELERPISCQITGARYETFSILRTSYEFMASEEKKKFFLMACLSPIGSSISIDNLMRYGIGLDLFQHVNKLSEAIDLARTWAEELVSFSMLLRGDSDEYVKIHDVVRDSTMSFASKSGLNTDGQMFLVDAIPRWICEETFNKYIGISLLAQANYVPLTGVKADLLQILLLKGNKYQNSVLESNFFQGMTNLKVLEVSFMNFEEGLPESMGRLKVLQTLHLLECKLGDIKLIGELRSLLVLSLRGSSLERLPDEIGKLHKLRLLDMSNCQCKETRLPANVMKQLSLLEGFYLINSNITEWTIREDTSTDTGSILQFLNGFEIRMGGPMSLHCSDQIVKNLDKFKIIFGDQYFKLPPSQRALMISTFDVSQELKTGSSLKALLKKADYLALKSTTVKNIVPELDEEGYRDLSHLELSNIDSISRICEGKAPPELFYNLCHLEVKKLEKLEELLPVNPLPRKMTTLKIFDCNNLTYIFSEDDRVNKESVIIKLPCLKTLVLDGVSNLRSVVKESTNDDSPCPNFFNSKVRVTLASLERLTLKNNKWIVKLSDNESNLHSFQNLKVLNICHCSEMESIGPLSMFLSLVQLETLIIQDCKKMQQVIRSKMQEVIPKQVITFLKLKHLEIRNLEKLECFYGGSYKVAFPQLEKLLLHSLKRMTKFHGGEDSSAFFPKTIEFPCLEKLELKGVSDEVRVIWELDEGESEGIISSNPPPNLRELTVGEIKLPSVVFPSLCCLTLDNVVGDAKFLFSSTENEGCIGTISQFPNLEQLEIQGCPNSVQQIVKEDGSTAMLNFCGQLRCLSIKSALNMNVISLHPFNSLVELGIRDMRWEYLFSANEGFELWKSLKRLRIHYCPNLEVIIRGNEEGKDVVFPQLIGLYLLKLERMTKFSSISNIPIYTPSLQSVSVDSCNKLELTKLELEMP